MHHLERDDTLRCFHCGNIVPMKLVGRDVSTWDEGDNYIGVEEWSFYMCPTCKEPTLVCWYWQQKGNEITSDIDRSIAFPDNLFDNRSVPEIIRKAFMDAAATKSMDQAVSLIAWRRVLELTCKDLGATGKNLYEKITDLSSRNIFPQTLKEASNLVRVLGNAGAHSDEIEPSRISMANVEALVRNIIEYVYILPQKISNISSNYIPMSLKYCFLPSAIFDIFNEQPLIFPKFLPFTISAKLPKVRTKPGKPVYIRLSGLRLH